MASKSTHEHSSQSFPNKSEDHDLIKTSTSSELDRKIYESLHALNEEEAVNDATSLLNPEFDVKSETESILSRILEENIEVETKVEYYEQKEEKEEFNLEKYYSLYNQLTHEFMAEKAKNKLLQRLLQTYYIRKKMFSAIREIEVTKEHKKKYEKELDTLSEVTEKSNQEISQMAEEMVMLKKKCAVLQNETDLLFKKFQDAELEVSKQFLSSEQSETVHRQKFVDSRFSRQKVEWTNLHKIRLQSVTIKNRISKAERELNLVDNLGPNIRLSDYEEEKKMNTIFSDKVDDRQRELIEIRKRYQNTMQRLAHVREQTNELDKQIRHLQRNLEFSESSFEDCRSQIQCIKKEKTEIRNLTLEMKKKLGLISHPLILTDMKNVIKEINILSTTILNCQREYDVILQKQKNIKQIKKIIYQNEEDKPL